MTKTISAWLKLLNFEQTCGFYRGFDQKGAFFESSGKLHRPQIKDFTKNESKLPNDQILTASIKFELVRQNPIFEIPEEYSGKCIGTGQVSRSMEESLHGRKIECFRTNLNLHADESIVRTLVELRHEWFRFEAVVYAVDPNLNLDNIELGSEKEILIERYFISSNIEQ